jgi:AI-2 transport protein TqsA
MEILKDKSIISTCAFLVITLAGIMAASGIIIPFLLAIFIAIISNPLANLLEKARFPRPVAVITTLVAILCVGTLVTQLVSTSISGFSENMPFYKTQLISHLQSIPGVNEAVVFDLSLSSLLGKVEPDMAMSAGVNLLSGLSDVLGNIFLILLASTFMMLEINIFKEKLNIIFPGTKQYSDKIDSFVISVKSYMVIKTLISLLTGVIISIMLWIVGVDHFLLWGLLGFLLNYIPNIGSIFAAIPPVCLAFIQFGSGTALLVLLLFVAINMIVGSVIEPKFMGSGLGLSTLIVFISLIFWGWVLGPVGMLLSIPLTMVVKIASNKNDDWHWVSVMLSDNPKK